MRFSIRAKMTFKIAYSGNSFLRLRTAGEAEAEKETD
jgi:hypothetical protein